MNANVLPRWRQPSATQIQVVKVVIFILCVLPAVRLGVLMWRHELGANPIEHITRATGWWTLAMLALTLAVTPLRRILSVNWLLRVRRMLGLYCFFYASLHFVTYVWLDQFFDWPGIVADVIKRPFITVGFSALLAMTPLALTSANAMVRRLGAKRWLALHRLVYLVAILGAVHFLWLVKKDLTEPLVFFGVFALLLGARVGYWLQDRRPGPVGHGRSSVAKMP
jgi:sulfoxide reductase heme-binding subunit YedZ